jgi:hypothetical protein
MTTSTILLLILSIFAAGGWAYYQYFYKNSSRSSVTILLAVLRFVSVFGFLLLLINPIITRQSYLTEKTPLVLAIDNSSSIKELAAGEQASKALMALRGHSGLKEKFAVDTYAFDSDFTPLEGLPDFSGTHTNIDAVGRNLRSLYRHRKHPTVLITDGNQTIGNDYLFSFENQGEVFPIILGDTTTFADLRISRLNVNKYAFLKNKFPVEVFLQYNGLAPVTASFTISQGGSVISRETVSFSASKSSAVLNILMPAEKVGLQVFKASLTSSLQEKNTYNNVKNFAVEVIDQRTEVALISSISHPDLGALKRAIESNAQRRVTLLKPQDLIDFNKYNVVILYQPSQVFRPALEALKKSSTGYFLVTGASTDFTVVNQFQDLLQFQMSGQGEEYQAEFNSQFNLYAAENIGVTNLPPLHHSFGSIKSSPGVTVLLDSKIRNMATGHPLLAFSYTQGKRSAFLIGENIWKWRLQSHVEHQSFDKFDVFTDKIIQFLSTDNKRRSLVVHYDRFYSTGDPLEISAEFFNKNYEFDNKARLSIRVTHRDTKKQKTYEMLRGVGAYMVNLEGLDPGKYDFTVRELNANVVENGSFEILDFDIEKQFVNPDVVKLKQLAESSAGNSYLPNEVESLIERLRQDPQYQAVQRPVTSKTPLIEWIWLLIVVAAALSAEWFIRKYNGML